MAIEAISSHYVFGFRSTDLVALLDARPPAHRLVVCLCRGLGNSEMRDLQKVVFQPVGAEPKPTNSGGFELGAALFVDSLSTSSIAYYNSSTFQSGAKGPLAGSIHAADYVSVVGVPAGTATPKNRSRRGSPPNSHK
jgi:hypothetical protein